MIYTSGVISDITREETLEELQDNKLTVMADKIDLKKEIMFWILVVVGVPGPLLPPLNMVLTLLVLLWVETKPNGVTLY